MLITSLLSAALLLQSPKASASPQHEPPVMAALEFAGYDDAGDVRLVIDAPTVAKLDRASHASVQLALSPLEIITLRMERFEVVAPDAKFWEAKRGGQSAIASPDVVFLRGEVAGEPLSHAFLALIKSDASQGLGTIIRQSGERWNIGAEQRSTKSSLILRRGEGDVPDFEHFCTVIPAPVGEEGGVAGIVTSEAAGPRVLNIAVDSDQRFWRLFNNNQAAVNYIAMVIGAVSDIYIRDLQMRAVLRLGRIWPNGGEPFTADNLSGFRQYWVTNEDMQGLNLVHMFSGARDTSYGGVAYLANGCTNFGFGISAFLNGSFPSPVAAPNLGNWDVNVVAHEMGHNLGTPHTHDLNPPIDTCAQGSTERGTIMSYCHTRAGGLLNIDMYMHAANQDIIADDNPLSSAFCLWNDCNGNLINDVEDIVFGRSLDANADGIPDECQDCNGNGILDPLDIANGAADVNANGIPDSCEIDCNGNGQPDRWECQQNPTIDRNGNRVPDSCEPDCNGNNQADFIDIAEGSSMDLDRNSRPDECDDCNANGVADWIDYGRALNVFIAQADDLIASPVREYHAQSGVLVRDYTGTPIQDSFDLAFGPDRQLYVISWFDNRVVKINVDTGAATTFITQAAAGFTSMSSLVFTPGGTLLTASPVNGEIRKYDSSGAFVGLLADLTGAPWDMAFGPNGDLYVLTNANGVPQLNPTTGAVIGTFASPANLNQPRGMCFMPDGRLLVVNWGNNTIRAFSAAGVDLGQWNDEFPVESPWGITVGPNGHVFTARRASPVRIVEYATNGRYIRSFIRGDDDLTHPTSIAFRPASPADANQNFVLDVCEDICVCDIAPAPAGDGQVNVGDLLAVITHWGSCPTPPAACIGDVAPPPTGNGQVNVSDLLAIITSWGACH